MPKILLAEDDANLREIFEMRLKSEGFDVVTAGDGEEALVVAAKEKPDLVVVDIMMPKISGFEMLETLRSNPETAQVKAIMMTALGQVEDRQRGESLGVLKYLVKSQVTLEDFVKVIKEVFSPNQNNQKGTNMDDQQTNNPATDNSMPSDGSAMDPAAQAAPAAPPADDSAAPSLPADEPTVAEEKQEVEGEMNSFTPPTPEVPAPAPEVPPTEPAVPEQPAAPAPEVPTEMPPAPEVPAPAPETPAAEPAAPEQPASDPTATPGETVEPSTPEQPAQ